MLKQPITYTDFDGNEVTDVLYFNISKTELADNMHLQARFESLLATVQGASRELTQEEIREILDLVKTVMKLAYGVRSEDGKKFRKSEEIWNDFKDSAAYDAYLFSLFESAERANNFLLGAMPQDLREQAEKQIASKAAPLTGVATTPEPPLILTDEELLTKDPLTMSHDQLIRAMQLRNQK